MFEKDQVSAFLTGFILAVTLVFFALQALPTPTLSKLFSFVTVRPNPFVQNPDSSDEEEDEDDERQKNPQTTPPIDFPRNSACKLVLVVRTDLGMTKGKIAAQCGHATLASYRVLARQGKGSRGEAILRAWERNGEAKIALKCDSEEEMLQLQKHATSKGIVARSILDAGKTQIEAGTRTVLAVGPDVVDRVSEITGHLKLL
ncbi:hypothetical protein HK096_004544 [Nowakowskiella sp. JEL0078]|nr:hypothetical protein HK096_004544 [Nowakowskiella sp. JEL0078]